MRDHSILRLKDNVVSPPRYSRSPSRLSSRSSQPPTPERLEGNGNHQQERNDEGNPSGNNQDARRLTKRLSEYIVEYIEFYKVEEGYGFEEQQKRYTDTENMMYFEEGMKVAGLRWSLMLLEEPAKFLNELAEIIWDVNDLANRALDLNKVTSNIPRRSPVRLIERSKLRLLISLYYDYLRKRENLSNAQRSFYLHDVTNRLKYKIRNLRTKAKNASERKRQNARKILRYNMTD